MSQNSGITKLSKGRLYFSPKSKHIPLTKQVNLFEYPHQTILVRQ